jgi:hypothetical protein
MTNSQYGQNTIDITFLETSNDGYGSLGIIQILIRVRWMKRFGGRNSGLARSSWRPFGGYMRREIEAADSEEGNWFFACHTD